MKFDPHPYQQYGIDFIINNPAAGLFWEMGLGKTVTTLTAVNELKYNYWAISRVLVVAPKKVAEATWSKEAEKWDHLRHLKVNAMLGPVKKRVRALDTPGDIWVTNRENVPWLVDYCRNKWPFDMVILDESTSFKNPKSQRFRALKLVRSRIARVVALTGTPAPNGLEDLWSQVYLLDRGYRLGKTMASYREAFFTEDYRRPGQQYSTYSPNQGADDRIKAAISDICVSMRSEDYLTLPPFIEDVVPVVLDAKSKKAYDELEKEMLLEVDDQTITAGSAAVLNGKLLQLCSGAVYDEQKQPVIVHRCKIEAFLEVIEQLHGEHALVFYWFQHEQVRLLEALAGSGLRVRVYKNADDEAAWNAGNVDILLAHPASCAYGLNLQFGGRHEIWFGYPNWALELYQQANARLYRQGQDKPVISHMLVVQGGMDETVVAALQQKGDTQADLMDALRVKIRRAKEQ